MKRWLVTLLAAAVALCSAAVAPASAVQIEADQLYGRIHEFKEFCDRYQGAIDAIAAGTYRLEKRVDVSAYQIPYTVDNARTLSLAVRHTHPELFFVSNSFSYGGTYDYRLRENVISHLTYHWGKMVYDENGQYMEITYTDDEVRQMQAEFRARAQWYLDKVDEDMSDFEKALVLHDALAVNGEYLISGDIYDFMVNGKGKCYGYSECYSYLLAQVGIESEIVESDSMNHQWNKVKIDGEYYHVDVTWDDPLPDAPGRAAHTFFLLSDNAIENLPSDDRHEGYVSDYPSTDTRYDEREYHRINSRFCYAGGELYTVDNTSSGATAKSLCRYDAAADSFTAVQRFDDEYWSAGGNSYWLGSFMRLDEQDGYLYLNTPDKILTYDTANGESAVFAVNTFAQEFYGVRVIDGKVYGATSESPLAAGTLQYVGDCLTRPAAPADVYVAAGSAADIFGARWDAAQTENQMTESGGVYTKTYTVEQAYDEVRLLVVKNGSEWFGDPEGKQVSFALTGAGVFTVTFDPVTNIVTVDGENVAPLTAPAGVTVDVMGGDGLDTLRTMQETDDDVYEIVIPAVPQGTARQLVFIADGNPDWTFGGSFTADGEVTDAVLGGSAISFDTPWHSQSVAVRLDLSGFSFAAGTGATFTVTVLPDPLTGDVNGDDAVTVDDATLLQRYLSEYVLLTEQQLALADANGDGKVNIRDVTFLQRQIAELIG